VILVVRAVGCPLSSVEVRVYRVYLTKKVAEGVITEGESLLRVDPPLTHQG